MRDDKITMAKAIAIILMVICHAGLPGGGEFIAMFHMPLFFFVSGFCFKDRYLNDGRQFFINKVKSLYVPFVKWSLIFLMLHNVFYNLNIYNGIYGFNGQSSCLYGIKDMLFHALRILFAMNETEQLLGGFWFLKQLFCGSFLALLCFKYMRSDIYGAIALLAAAMLLSWLDADIPFFHISSLTFLSAFFIVTGRVYKKMPLNLDKWGFSLFSFIAVLTGSILCGTSMLTYSTKQILPYSICAILGTIMVLNISEHLIKVQNFFSKILMYIGDHTLVILTWHFLSFKIVSLLLIWMYKLPVEQLAYFPTIPEYSSRYWPLYSIVGIVIPVGGNYIIQRAADYFTARQGSH